MSAAPRSWSLQATAATELERLEKDCASDRPQVMNRRTQQHTCSGDNRSKLVVQHVPEEINTFTGGSGASRGNPGCQAVLDKKIKRPMAYIQSVPSPKTAEGLGQEACSL